MSQFLAYKFVDSFIICEVPDPDPDTFSLAEAQALAAEQSDPVFLISLDGTTQILT